MLKLLFAPFFGIFKFLFAFTIGFWGTLLKRKG